MNQEHSIQDKQRSLRTIPNTYENNDTLKLQEQVIKISGQSLAQKRLTQELSTRMQNYSNETNRKINRLFQLLKQERKSFDELMQSIKVFSTKERMEFRNQKQKSRDEIQSLRMRNSNLQSKLSNLTERVNELQWQKLRRI